VPVAVAITSKNSFTLTPLAALGPPFTHVTVYSKVSGNTPQFIVVLLTVLLTDISVLGHSGAIHEDNIVLVCKLLLFADTVSINVIVLGIVKDAVFLKFKLTFLPQPVIVGAPTLNLNLKLIVSPASHIGIVNDCVFIND
jgi:hypothetical protein